VYIKKLIIKNFRNFGDTPFEMPLQPLTLLLGENNIGKTNLLHAVALLFGQELSLSQRRLLEIDDINYETVATFKKQVANLDCDVEDVAFPEVTIDAFLTGMNDQQHDVVGDWYVGTDLTQAQVTYRFFLRSNFKRADWIKEQRRMLEKFRTENNVANVKGENDDSNAPDADGEDDPVISPSWQSVDFPIGEYRYTIYGSGLPSNECDSHWLQMLRVELLDALRDAKRELMQGGEQRLLYRVLRQGSDTRYSDLKGHLMALESAVRKNKALKNIKGDVSALLKRVSLVTEKDDNSIDFQFSAPDAAELLKKIGMIYGSNPITVARNGLGRNNLLYVALVLSQLAKAADLKAGQNESVCFRFVGIEEPEAHLHPHLQDHLANNVEAIRDEHDKRLQLLLTSHSTHIAAKLRLSNTAVMFRDDINGRLSCHYVLDNIDVSKEKDAIRFLSLYLDATKSRMFFARRLILVEGITEQTVVPVLFEKSEGKTLEAVGCTILNVNGVSFRHFLTIIRNGFFRKCVVLTDRDTGTKVEERADKLKADFDDGKVINIQKTTESTFEKDLITANCSGHGKQLLLSALEATKPNSGAKFRESTGKDDIDAEAFFDEIANYKTEFAFNLVVEMRQPSTKLIPPKYIKDAFNFIK
jgi:predicted ATP-dependent endonuclease of OLD family